MAAYNNRALGTYYEQKTAEFLEENGILLITSNFRGKQGEIDLIGRDGHCLVFFEVKYRSSNRYGYGMDAVDHRKQYRICRTADYYLYLHPLVEGESVRFDVISIDRDTYTWIKDAFYYIER